MFGFETFALLILALIVSPYFVESGIFILIVGLPTEPEYPTSPNVVARPIFKVDLFSWCWLEIESSFKTLKVFAF